MTQRDGAIDSHGAQWREWVFTNVAAGCDPRDMANRMVEGGWRAARALEALNFAAQTLAQAEQGLQIALPHMPPLGISLCAGHRVCTTMTLASPPMAVCHDVLTPDECTALLAYAQTRGLTLSTVVDDANGEPIPHPERTSSGLMLKRGETGLVSRIEARLAALTQWPVDHGEGLQILRYRPGQEYRAHFDAFPPGAGGDRHRANGGERVNTVLVYLKTPERGGGTSFPNLGLTLCPPAGTAVIFGNVDAMGCRLDPSLHAGQPVELGEKVVLTYWQRERAFG